MANHVRFVVCLGAVVMACGGSKPRPSSDPPPAPAAEPTPAPIADDQATRLAAAQALIPAGTNCLPPLVKSDHVKLTLTTVGADALVCAIDHAEDRLLGPLACWKVDLATGALTYQPPRPPPRRSVSVLLEGRCAMRMCIPEDATLPADKVIHMAWNTDGTKAAMLASGTVFVFDVATRSRETQFDVGDPDKGVTNTPAAIHWVGDSFFIEGHDAGPAAYVFRFRNDGSAMGGLTGLGTKDIMLSTYGGSFVVLDEGKVGIAEQGFSTLHTLDVATGKRTKVVRKTAPNPCKPDHREAFWLENGEPIAKKCKSYLEATFRHLIGADAVAGKTHFLALLHGPRLGELAVLSNKDLTEKSAIKLRWCDGGAAATP